MDVATPSWLAFLLFGVSLLALAALSAQISLELQRVVYHLTGSIDYAVVVFFLLLLPGILIHEASHWIVAKVLGLKPGKFRVWPVRKGRMVGLGSVTTRSGGIWLDSLVGIAPLVMGTLLVGFLSRQWFAAEVLANAFSNGSLRGWLESLSSAFRQPDAALWAYLVFTIANGMMPSAPDREPVKPVLVYVGLAALGYLLLGLPLDPVRQTLEAGSARLMWLNSALVVTIALDVVVLVVLFLLSALTAPRRR